MPLSWGAQRNAAGMEMRQIAFEKAGRWDLALACASLSLVMLVLTGVLYSQHHKPRAAPVLVSDVLR